MATFATHTRSNSNEQHASFTQSQKSENHNTFSSNPFNKSPFNKGPEEFDDKKQTKKNSVGDGVSQLSSFFKGTGTPVVQTRLKVGQRKNKEEGDVSQKMPEAEPEVQTKNETGMPSALKSGLESLSGEDLSGVRVHRNSSKPEAIDAHAYAQGQDIHLAPGQEKHLPHEGWHVVQQMQGRVQPTMQKKSMLINDDDGLEKEADVMGAKAMQMKSKDSTANVKNANAKNAAHTGIVQRAMKFEYQFQKNFLYLDNGSEIHPLPRKFGPRDYLVHDSSGATLETETDGQIECETTWEKKWPKLLKQVKAIQDMAKKINDEPANELGSDGNMYRKFPASFDLQHLRPNSGFSMINSIWNPVQKHGEAEVKNSNSKVEYENFRSTPDYTSSANIIGQINNGEKVFVHYQSSDGKWSKIEYNGTQGWMWSLSLTGMESQKFESNKDSRNKYSDKPLKAGEKLLVEVNDPNWAPYTQISESFELEQYESYLEQYDQGGYQSTTPPLLRIQNTKQLLLNNNPQIIPKGETQTEKDLREKTFLDENNKLKNLLLMVTQYIDRGKNQSEPGSAKYTFNLMSRTHFGSIFNSMTKKEQLLFTQIVNDKTKGIIPDMGLTTNSKFFLLGTGPGYNPTVYDWLISITTGGDLLSSREYPSELPGAMGRFKLNEEKGMHKGLVRFEARNDNTIPNFPVLDDLDDHALKHFNAAMANRSRPTNKGGTGLEP